MVKQIVTPICTSCNRPISPVKRGSTSFPCPECGTTIVRCAECREFSNKYKCVNCGFEGP